MSRTESAPAFQLYAADAVADTAALTLEEAGMYWRLMLHAWREHGVPADPARLARVAGVSPKKFAAAWPLLAPSFEQREDRWVLPWQEAQRDRQAEIRAKRADAGKTGNAKRWAGRKREADAADSVASASQVRPGCEANGVANDRFAVAVVVAKDKQPKGGDAAHQRPRPRREPAPWMGLMRDVWQAAYHGPIKPGAADLLRPFVEEHGESVVAQHLATYCQRVGVAYGNVPDFVSKFGSYAPGSEAAPAASRPPDDAERLYAALESADLLRPPVGDKAAYWQRADAVAKPGKADEMRALVARIEPWTLTAQGERRFCVAELRRRLTHTNGAAAAAGVGA